jgi:hypothetical protein
MSDSSVKGWEHEFAWEQVEAIKTPATYCGNVWGDALRRKRRIGSPLE